MFSKSTNCILKVVMVGDSKVGKSSILSQYTDHKYNKKHMATVGVDLKINTIKYKKHSIKMQIWDTSGADKFRSIIEHYLRQLNALIVVFSLNDRTSFNHVNDWINTLRQHNSNLSDVTVLIVGNKKDLVDERVVSKKEIETLMQDLSSNWQYSADYIETCVKDEDGLSSIFEKIAKFSIEDKPELFYTIPLDDHSDTKQLVTTSIVVNDPKVNYLCCCK